MEVTVETVSSDEQARPRRLVARAAIEKLPGTFTAQAHPHFGASAAIYLNGDEARISFIAYPLERPDDWITAGAQRPITKNIFNNGGFAAGFTKELRSDLRRAGEYLAEYQAKNRRAAA